MKLIRKIMDFILKPLVRVKIIIPVWLVIALVLIPLIIHADFIIVGQTNWFTYLIVNLLEVALVYIGYLLGINTIK